MDHKDFINAKFTAIVSDLHLCEAEPLHPKFPLWKKYKTREFFFDDAFAEFLKDLTQKSGGEEIELVLNGDIFDFDSVMTIPENPIYRVSWLEKSRGLHPEEEKSVFKLEKILGDHPVWMEALHWFVMRGHKVVFVIGNHDLELHWPKVKHLILDRLHLPEIFLQNIRFTEWFYISNKDTLVEHGNQYDPYCLCLDPVSPYILRENRVEIRLPFGNMTTRYMVNVMGFFNPHVDTNFIMSLKEYTRFFFKYMVRAQPLIVWTWFWSSFLVMCQTVLDALLPPLKDPLRIEDRIEDIAYRSNATPRMVREMKELFVGPATKNPLVIAQELWMDRALMFLVGVAVLFQLFLFIKQVFAISVFWMFIPIILLLPFFLFYSRGVRSYVILFKEPQERILSMASQITQTKRIVYGHTHVVRHEIIGAVEHLNSGSWSPAFLDVECTKPIGQRTFIWIHPSLDGAREAHVFHFKGTHSVGLYPKRSPRRKRRRMYRRMAKRVARSAKNSIYLKLK